MLYVAGDGQLGCLSSNHATALGKENGIVLPTVLNTLNKNWNVDRPFEKSLKTPHSIRPQIG